MQILLFSNNSLIRAKRSLHVDLTEQQILLPSIFLMKSASDAQFVSPLWPATYGKAGPKKQASVPNGKQALIRKPATGTYL